MTNLHNRLAVLLIVSTITLFAATNRILLFEEGPSKIDPDDICLELEHSGRSGLVCALRGDELIPTAVRTLGIPGECLDVQLPPEATPCSRVTLAGLSPCKVLGVMPMPATRRLICGGRIDPNSDSIEDLVMLPGIGETRARAIVLWREEKGPFRRIEDLQQVRGIGPKTAARVAPWISLKH